jgi:hypothetical protein
VSTQLCFGLIALALPFTEGMAPFWELHKLGLPILLANGALAFSLNLAGVLVIQSAGSLALTLGGVCKDIILITMSVVIFGSAITGLQVAGEPTCTCLPVTTA